MNSERLSELRQNYYNATSEYQKAIVDSFSEKVYGTTCPVDLERYENIVSGLEAEVESEPSPKKSPKRGGREKQYLTTSEVLDLIGDYSRENRIRNRPTEQGYLFRINKHIKNKDIPTKKKKGKLLYGKAEVRKLLPKLAAKKQR